jgi:hypothetical protein
MDARKLWRVSSSTNLERLTLTLDGVATELGELVEEQHVVMRQRS